ncbi:hypothetical protein BD410DRAFT_897318 [Rickenella mellea]|uniref:Rxt3-domain-containing protein n=1 Tax=Rickenella mellea TaxID=50990 RepID=A0A4Y7QA03_9AGAM|nr:hypothetical protein BD410DRAFT_897318 [Rickenella mellea]
MNVADLLHDAPSDDHRRRQEARDREHRERELREREQHAQQRERERERDREREARLRDADHDSRPTHRQPPPPPPHHSHHISHPSSFSQFQVYDNDHRPRDSPFGQTGPASAGHSPFVMEGRQPMAPSHPSSSASPSHTSPLFMSTMAASAHGQPPGPSRDYINEHHGARDSFGREKKYTPHGHTSQTLPLYPSPTGPLPEHTRSGSLSRPRSPPFPDYSGHSTPLMNSSHSQIHSTTTGPGSHPLSRSPSHPSPFSMAPQPRDHLSPVTHSASAAHTSPMQHAGGASGPVGGVRRGGSGGGGGGMGSASHVHESPAMGSLRPFEDQGFSSRAAPGSSSTSAIMPREKDRDRDRDRLILKDDKERQDREPFREKDRDRPRKVRPVAPNGAAHTAQALAPATPSSSGPGYTHPDQQWHQRGLSGSGQSQPSRRHSGEDRDRDRDREWERREREREREAAERGREDMNTIRAAASARLQLQGSGPAQAHHHHHPLPHHHVHAHPPTSTHQHSHSHHHAHQSHAHSQQHSHGHQSHSHPPKPNKNVGILTLAPPGVTVTNTLNRDVPKPEVLPLAPPHLSAPASPTLPLQLAPSSTYQPPPPPKHAKQQQPFSVMPTPLGGPGAAPVFAQPYNINHAPSHPLHSAQAPPQPIHHQLPPHPNHRLIGSPLPPLPPPPPTQQPYPQHFIGPGPSTFTPPPYSPPEPESTLPPVHLGTFVHPNTPFPYFFSSKQREERRDTRVTVLIPNGYLPRKVPHERWMRIWGGGLPAELQQYPYHNNLAMGMRERDNVVQRTGSGRRVYTDDSDMLLCALHAGKITWPGVQLARRAGGDLRVELSVRRDGRYIGGPGALARFSLLGDDEVDAGLKSLLRADTASGKRDEKKLEGEYVSEDMICLRSASWGNGHDGSGVEVLRAEWVPRGTAHTIGLRNRGQRLAEYGERRLALLNVDPSNSQSIGKRSRKASSISPDSVLMLEDDQASAKRSVVFGGNRADSIGFKYDPAVVQSLLFPAPSKTAPVSNAQDRRKRRKLNGSPSITDELTRADSEMDLDSELEGDLVMTTPASTRAMILENDEEQFVLRAVGFAAVNGAKNTEAEKENRGSGVLASIRQRRWHVFLVGKNAAEEEKNEGGKGVVVVNGARAKDELDSQKTCASTPLEKEKVPRSNSKKKAVVVHEDLPVPPNGVREGKRGVDAQPSTDVPASTTITTMTVQQRSQPLQLLSTKTLQPLHRDIGENDIEFREDGVVVMQRNSKGDGDAGWFLRVQRWKWAT